MTRNTDGDALAPPKTESAGLLRLSGSVEHVIYANEENGYCICDFGTEENELLTITGTIAYVAEGDVMTLYGRWVHNPKYGRQFKVERYEKQLPADKASILRYLSSGAVKGIGPKTAQRIVETFGEESFDVIENHPEWLADVRGITVQKARAISEDFCNKAGIRSAMMFFREFFGAALTVRIYKKWGNSAIEVAKRNPYALCEEIEGIGFERADSMAQRLGLDRASEERLCSGILYLLSTNASQNGHVCLPREKLLTAAVSLLECSSEKAEEALSVLVRENRICEACFDGERYLYEKQQYQSEKYIAKKLMLLDRVCPAMNLDSIQPFIEKEEYDSGIRYAALQRKAIADALENGVLLLTGGPGTGKTTVVRALLHIFGSMDWKVALCAPTGRAAKRLSEATSYEAKTIHRLLEYGGEEGGRFTFHRDEKALLDENVIIVDEASMVDNQLMCALMRAVKPGAHVVIIGDVDQLSSVGAGNVLFDLLESNVFATVRLNEIFRQAQKSLIITNAHAINRGQMPVLTVKDNDFFFLPRETDAEIAATVAQLCAVRLPRTYGKTAEEGTQVIAPSRKGEVGTEHLNVLLQQALNPASEQKREHRVRELVFREGDRVMQTRNNYDLEWERSDGTTGLGVFNGDIGTVLQIDAVNERMEIQFDERRVSYEFQLLDELEPAYAVTVHKSQGSEYPIVVLPLGSVPTMLLNRNLFYTAVTRAQRLVILVGRESVIRAMVSNHRQTMRYTGLLQWLKKES